MTTDLRAKYGDSAYEEGLKQQPRTFERLLGLREGQLTPGPFTNTSFSMERIELCRQLNLAMVRRGWVGDYMDHTPPLGLFARARVLRVGSFAFGLEGAFSREYHTTSTYSQMKGGPYDVAYGTWTWDPSYRADLQAFAEASSGPWSLRLQAGAGMRLSNPDFCWCSSNSSSLAKSAPHISQLSWRTSQILYSLWFTKQ